MRASFVKRISFKNADASLLTFYVSRGHNDE